MKASRAANQDQEREAEDDLTSIVLLGVPVGSESHERSVIRSKLSQTIANLAA